MHVRAYAFAGMDWRKQLYTVFSAWLVTNGLFSFVLLTNAEHISTSCDFDTALCNGWRQSCLDVFDWTRETGSTYSYDTGPDFDHTSGSGYYMYIETSSPRMAGDNAKLEISVSGKGELSCLEFYYHMYGDTMGTLNVFSGNTVVFSLSGNQGDYWIKVEKTIYLDNTVTFEGIAGSSFTGDLAIDDVSITNGSCQGQATPPPPLLTASTALASTSCNFDNGLCCDWQQSIADVFDWTINTGSTRSSNTGPDYDHTSGLGSYVYIETSSPRQYGDNAKLEFSVSNSEIGKLSCLRFYYHMYGETINALNVYNGITKIFSKSGNQRNLWLNAKLTMTLQTTLTFEGIRGSSYTGDIAIDDVSIVRGICQECIENVNQSFGILDISYSNRFDPYCNWIVGNAGIPQAVAIVSISQMNFSDYGSDYVKIFDGNGTEVFARHGWNSTSSNKTSGLQETSFEHSKNITIQVSLINQWSSVKISYGSMKKPLNLASLLAGWSITVARKTARSVWISWNSPASLLYSGIRFYVALARKINGSSESTGEIVPENVTASEITELDEYTEYKVSAVAVDGNGMPFKSSEVLVKTDEGVPSRAPNGLRVTTFEFTSDLLVEWSPLSQQYANGKLLGYTIYYLDYNYFWSPYKSVNTSSPYLTQVTLTGLKHAHEYLVAVAAFTSKGVGPWSAHIYAITGCSITLNKTFGQIEFTTTSYHDVRCNWKIHNAGISKAIAFISVQEINLYYCSEFVKIIDGNGTEMLYHVGCVSFAPEILADVPFGLSNNISIQVYTQSYGNNIKMKYAILKEGLTSAIPVLGWNVTIFNLTSTNFNVQWTKLHSVINKHANFYIIEVKSVQGTVLNLETVPGNITITVIKGLKPTSKYRVGVFGIDSVGQPYKSLESVTTTKEVICGFRPSTSRIVGGTVAPVNSWPWQVMVTDEYGYHFCGGSLVDPYWVVTAAHCLPGHAPSDVKIRLGAHYRTIGSVGTEQNIDVTEIIMHENYDIPLDNSNDIALLHLASPAELGVGVGLVCLPDTGHQLPFDDLNKRCWITGWGSLSAFWGSSPDTLMQASLPLVSKQRCENAYPGEIDDSMLCAGLDEGGVDSCQGDSGGPLVCEFSGRWFLEGVTSWGYGCAEPGHYGVYANVRALSSWLSTNMYTVVAPSASTQNQSLPQNQSSSATGWCNFDHGLCSGWNQSSSDDFDWTLGSGSTSSSSTGPTHGQGGLGKYMYIEASYPRKPGEIAKLVVTVPNNGNQSCLSFYYHMYGASVGTLNVYNGNIKVFTATGNQGDNWLIMEVNLYLDGVITFEGIIGSSYAGDVAIDEVKITEGSCPVSCSFDNGLCLGWSQSTSDVFDWTLNSGPTWSSYTGPSSDLSGTGKYMYTEATAQSVGDNAKLHLAVPRGYSNLCLTFFYHMYGYSMGTLNVFNGNTTIFTASGDHGDYWRKVIRTVNSGEVLLDIFLDEIKNINILDKAPRRILTFEGIIGWSYTGDIAIDNVTVSEGNCPDSTACNFDSGLCDGWQQSYSDVFDWTINTGSTWSSDTGPDYDHTTGTGYYMYIETSWPRVAGDNAKLEFSVPGNGELFCLEFYYHMYGDTMGTLAVFSGGAVVFNASGNHNNTWIKAEISIHLDSTVTFEGIVGSSITGDLAIDDVSISSGNCQEHTASPTTFSTTSTFSPSVTSNPPTFNSPSSQASSSSGPSTSSPLSSQASSSSELSTSSPPSSQASSSSGSSTFIPSIKGPSSSSSLPSSALSGTSKSFTASPTPSIEEKQETVMMEIRHLNITAWNDQMESDFKTAVAKAANDYCSVYPPRCGLTTSSSRRKRSSDENTFTGDMVHILPGYPKKSTDDPSITLLAFYLQLSRGSSNNIVNKDVLKAIVENDESSIGGSVGGTIINVQPLISTTEEESDEESNPQNAIIIGTSVGVVILVAVIIALLFSLKRRKRLIAAKKKAGKGLNNNAYFNDAYCIDSKEQAIDMKRGDQTCSTGNVPHFEGHHYECVNDLHASSNHSAVVLKFPDSREGKNNVGFAAPIYQTLISGVYVPIYQPLNGGVDVPIYQPLNKSPGVRAEKASEGVAESVCQPPNNGVAASIYQTLKSSEP